MPELTPIVATGDEISVVQFILTSVAQQKFRLFIDDKTLEKVKPLFDKLGIDVNEYNGKIPDNSIVLKTRGRYIKITIQEGGKETTKSIAVDKFVQILTDILKRNEKSTEQSAMYEVEIPSELIEKIKNLGNDKNIDSDGDDDDSSPDL